jgi:hypothetical protein
MAPSPIERPAPKNAAALTRSAPSIAILLPPFEMTNVD